MTLEVLEALDPARLSDAQRLRALVLSQRVVAHTHAVGLRFAAAMDSTEGPDDWAQDEIACALGIGSMTGGRLLTTAPALAGRLKATAELLPVELEHVETAAADRAFGRREHREVPEVRAGVGHPCRDPAGPAPQAVHGDREVGELLSPSEEVLAELRRSQILVVLPEPRRVELVQVRDVTRVPDLTPVAPHS